MNTIDSETIAKDLKTFIKRLLSLPSTNKKISNEDIIQSIFGIAPKIEKTIFFGEDETITFIFTGEEADLYQEIIDKIVFYTKQGYHITTIESMIKNILAFVLNAPTKTNIPRDWEERWKIKRKELILFLNIPKENFFVLFPVYGIGYLPEPIVFSSMTIEYLTNNDIHPYQEDSEVYDQLEERLNLENPSTHQLNNEESIARARFEGKKAFLRISVHANEGLAAHDIALGLAERFIAILNCYQPIDRRPYYIASLFEPIQNKTINSYINNSSELGYSEYLEYSYRIESIDINGLLAQKNHNGLSQLENIFHQDDLLKQDYLIMKVAKAMCWIGQAHTEERLTNRFLNYVIAIEMVLFDNQKAEITKKLQDYSSKILAHANFINLSNIFGDNMDFIKDRVSVLYDLRSKIVHTGLEDFEVTKDEVFQIGILAKTIIITLLTKEPFKSMKSVSQLQEFLNPKPVTPAHVLAGKEEEIKKYLKYRVSKRAIARLMEVNIGKLNRFITKNNLKP